MIEIKAAFLYSDVQNLIDTLVEKLQAGVPLTLDEAALLEALLQGFSKDGHAEAAERLKTHVLAQFTAAQIKGRQDKAQGAAPANIMDATILFALNGLTALPLEEAIEEVRDRASLNRYKPKKFDA